MILSSCSLIMTMTMTMYGIEDKHNYNIVRCFFWRPREIITWNSRNCKCGVLLLEGGSWLAGLGVHPWRNGAVGRCGAAAGVGQGPWGSRTLILDPFVRLALVD